MFNLIHSMKPYDVVVIGAGRIGRAAARGLQKSNKKIAIVSLPEPGEDYFYHLIAALTQKAGTPLSPALVSPPGIPLDEIDFYSGPCQFEDRFTLRVQTDALSAKIFILATGAGPRIPVDLTGNAALWTSPLKVLATVPRPRSVLIAGGGPIGVCLAQVLAGERCSVAIISRSVRLLPKEEPEISSLASHLLEKAGVRVETGAEVKNVSSQTSGQIAVSFLQRGTLHHTIAHTVVPACGLLPNHEGIRLDMAGVYRNAEKGVVTNDEMRTSAPSIWAAGAVTGPPFFLSLETHQAKLLVNNITAPFFSKQRYLAEPLPFTCPLVPAFARVGLTEQEARSQFRDVSVVLCPIEKNPKAQLRGEFPGLIKLIGRKKGSQLLGAHILAPHAEEMVLTADLIMRAQIPLSELTEAHHWPVLTYGEALFEAVEEWMRQN